MAQLFGNWKSGISFKTFVKKKRNNMFPLSVDFSTMSLWRNRQTMGTYCYYDTAYVVEINPSSWKTGTGLSHTVNTISADYLATLRTSIRSAPLRADPLIATLSLVLICKCVGPIDNAAYSGLGLGLQGLYSATNCADNILIHTD